MIDFASLATRKATIEFLASWDRIDVDFYAEPGMRARVIAARINPRHPEIVDVTFDFSEFEDHNRGFESADWYGRDGELTTAREAGHYKALDSVYLSSEMTDGIVELSDAGVGFMATWKHSGSSLPYVAWLEAELALARSLAGDLLDSASLGSCRQYPWHPDSENPDMENVDPPHASRSDAVPPAAA